MDILLENGDVIPISIARQSATAWRLDIAEGTEKGISGDDVVSLLGGQALENFVPKAADGRTQGFRSTARGGVGHRAEVGHLLLPRRRGHQRLGHRAEGVSRPGLQVNLTLIETVTTASDESANGGNPKTETSLTAAGTSRRPSTSRA